MKQVIKNFDLTVVKEVAFKIEAIEIEYDVKELAQFAANFNIIMTSIKEAVKELVPVIANQVQLYENLKHSRHLESKQAERDAEKEKQENWRERNIHKV